MYRFRRIHLDRIDGYRPRIEAFVARLRRKFRISRVLLFGSFASDHLREDVHEMSDIDLVIVGDVPGEKLFDRAREVLALTRLPIEPWVYTDEEWDQMVEGGSSFAREVLDTAVSL